MTARGVLAIGAAGVLWLCSLTAAERPVVAPQATPPLPTGGVSPTVRAAGSESAAYDQTLKQYCVGCHNDRVRNPAGAPLRLDQLDLARVTADAEHWEKVIRRLRARSMPPAGVPRPDEATYDRIAEYVERQLDASAAVRPKPGRTSVHRLNRAEYANAVRDLLALDVDVRSLLPPDDSGYGFDNIADVLTISPTLLDRYLAAASKVARLAVGNPHVVPSVDIYRVPRFLQQDDRMSEDLPFGTRGGLAVRHYAPVDGEYVIGVRLKRNTVSDALMGIGRPSVIDVRVDGSRVDLIPIGERTRTDAELNVRVYLRAGGHQLGAAFIENDFVAEVPKRPALIDFGRDMYQDVDPDVERLEVTGPFPVSALALTKMLGPGEETPSRRRIFTCLPQRSTDEARCARTIVEGLARRAYRRPVNDAEVEPLLAFFEKGRASATFDAGIETVIRALLVSPGFLFRAVRQPTSAGAVPLDDLELASRLSFFLWSSIPDDELLDVASRKRLADQQLLRQQVRRLLTDARASALVTNFAGQWLELRNLRLQTPNTTLFRDWDESLRESFQRETELFVESIMREDRSVIDLLRADYTFVNERLARHYGIPNIHGSRFRRVQLGPESPRRGLLGHGSILTVTSYPDRTSPVLRGKWILANILGAPPPPPPPDVPSLPDSAPGQKLTTIRQRMEQHRGNPACATCHSRIDPLGFGLEKFDAIGAWRDDEAGSPIDAAGVLFDGTRFDGPAAMRDALLRQEREFVLAFTEKLLTYALGRGLESYDAPAVRTIVRNAAVSGYTWSSIVTGIVESMPFRMKTKEEGR